MTMAFAEKVQEAKSLSLSDQFMIFYDVGFKSGETKGALCILGILADMGVIERPSISDCNGSIEKWKIIKKVF